MNDQRVEEPEERDFDDVELREIFDFRRYFIFGGIAFFGLTITAVIVLITEIIVMRDARAEELYSLARNIGDPDKSLSLLMQFGPILAFFSGPLILVLAAVMSAFMGYWLLRFGGAAEKQVIPADDRQLLTAMLREDNQSGIDNYVKLSSLIGVTGMFTKVGLTGLPLATLGLTIFLVVIAALSESGALFNLAELTLGAFLGSYVQRHTSSNDASTNARRQTDY